MTYVYTSVLGFFLTVAGTLLPSIEVGWFGAGISASAGVLSVLNRKNDYK